jgi:predicted porin
LRAWGTDIHLFDDHVLRSKWNYQVNPRLSFRTIFQYSATQANVILTDLEHKKNFNTDFLITYMLHPGTALYVGYNHNLQNYDEDAINRHTGLFRTNRLINDDRQFFVKLSYLFRY